MPREDEIDLRVGEQRIDAERADAIFLPAQDSHLGGNIGASAQFHTGKKCRVAQIGHRYVTASDDADTELRS